MKEALIIISILSIIIFCIIAITRIVALIMLRYTIKKYKALIALFKKDKLPDKEPIYVPNSNRPDKLYRDKDIEKKKELEQEKAIFQNVQVMNNRHVEQEQSLGNIVGIVKPIGKWTALVMGEKITYLMQHAEELKRQSDKGYWQTKMHAVDHGMGRGRE